MQKDKQREEMSQDETTGGMNEGEGIDSGSPPFLGSWKGGLHLGDWMRLIREEMGGMEHSQNNLVRLVKKSTNGEDIPDTRTKRNFMQWERSLNHRARQWEKSLDYKARPERSVEFKARPLLWFYLPQESEEWSKRSMLMDRFWKWEKALNRKPAGKDMWFNIAV